MGNKENYQKAVELKKPWAETIIPIEAVAKEHCPTLSAKPLTFPGLPNNSFIPLSLSLDLALGCSFFEDPFGRERKALYVYISEKSHHKCHPSKRTRFWMWDSYRFW